MRVRARRFRSGVCGWAGRRVAAVGGVTAMAVAAVLAAGGAMAPGSADPGLVVIGVAQNPCHPQTALPLGRRVTGQFEAGSSVLLTRGDAYAGPGRTVPLTATVAGCVRSTAQADRAWLSAGTVPGATPAQRAMASRALLDLILAVRPDGAVLAGWRNGWEYVWPRDASWAVAALADTGHTGTAFRILRFLQRVQPADGLWAARYLPDGSGPVRDGRPAELDAVGWVPWATWSWYTAAAAADPRQASAELREIWPMVARAADAAAASLTSSGLPRPSMDYWENSTTQSTIETAAALEAGLRSAADLSADIGDRASAASWSAAAGRLSAAIRTGFGATGYQRTTSAGSGADAAVTFLGPPFEPPSRAVGRAVASAAAELRLPNGGMRPGTAWASVSDVAWTPETGFFALYDAATGQHAAANDLLAWLAAHRSRLGELPEQVNQDGKPASIAPLTWTDAIVLLALLAQQHRLPLLFGP
jgi:glucoamylase